MTPDLHQMTVMVVTLFNPDGSIAGVHEMPLVALQDVVIDPRTDGGYATALPISTTRH